MLQLLNPIWLIAIAGISIPVIIHLWNIRPGKTLRIGSIALLSESATKSTRSLKLSELLLLAVRCFLLIILAVLLSAPVWRYRNSERKTKGWLLIERSAFAKLYKEFKQPVDSLTAVGFELHYFSPGFEKTTTGDALHDTAKTAPHFNYWSLLNTLETRVPAGLPITMITENGLRHFSGTKPNLTNPIDWRTGINTDSAYTWIQQAYQTNQDSIRIVLGTSAPNANSYKTYTATKSNPLFNTWAEDGKLMLRLNNTDPHTADTATRIVKTDTLKIGIYANGDGRYVQSAITAIKQYTERRITIYPLKKAESPPAGLNFLFWLTDQIPPPNVPGAVIFKYATGRTDTRSSSIIVANGDNLSEISLLKRIEKTAGDLGSTQTLWRDGFGSALLTYEKAENVYRFYSHFDPIWTGLVWDEQFPLLLMPIVLGEPASAASNDRRQIAPAQHRPVNVNSALAPPAFEKDMISLSPIFWWLAFLLFGIERWLSHQKNKTQNA